MSKQAELLSLLSLLRPRRSDFAKLRVGSLGDGGYVLPDDLKELSAVLSIGIGAEVSFDQEFADRGLPIYQYDHTVEGPPVNHPSFQFHQAAWGPIDGDHVRTLNGMIQCHGLNKNPNNLLKFDVEGAEWRSIGISTDLDLKPFRIIVCELHGLNSLIDQSFFQLARQVLDRLTRNHVVVHLHANNCCGISLIEGTPLPNVVELTLLRKDRSAFHPTDEPIPGPLDYPSMFDRPDLVLNFLSN
jgi:hypothetical protein